MSGALGRFHFLSWARQGMAASLANPDYGGSLPARGMLQLGLTAESEGPSPSSQSIAPISAQLYGPGDVLGLDPSHVVRTEPRPFTPNYEPNYLAGIEFDHPALPWLFTPAAPAGARLRQQICSTYSDRAYYSIAVTTDAGCNVPALRIRPS